MAVTLLGGFGPGVLATAVAALIADYCFLPPVGSFAIVSPCQAVALALFVGMGIAISLVAETSRRNQQHVAAYKKEEALRESQEKLRQVEAASQLALGEQAETLRLRVAALDAAANAIALTDEEGSLQWVNSAFTRLTGCSSVEVIGRNARFLKSGKQDAHFYEDLWQTILSGSTWRGELINRRKDGSLYDEEMTITPVRSEDGRTCHFLAVKDDITLRKRVQVALRDSEERWATTLSSIGDAVISTDPNGNIQFMNSVAERLAGWPLP